MSQAGTEVLGLLLEIFGVMLLVSAGVTDCWRRDAKDQFSSVELSSRCRGLWGECLYDSMAGLWTCDATMTYLEALPAEILSMRVTLVSICVVTLLSILATLLGLRCTKFCDSTGHKGRLVWLSAALLLCGGLFGTSGLLWYGVETVLRYREEVAYGIPGITYELGHSYWLAAGGVACMLTAAGTLLTTRCLSRSAEAIIQRQCDQVRSNTEGQHGKTTEKSYI